MNFNSIMKFIFLLFSSVISCFAQARNKTQSLSFSITKVLDSEKMFSFVDEYKLQVDYLHFVDLVHEYYKQTLEIESLVEDLLETTVRLENEFEHDCQKYIKLTEKTAKLFDSKHSKMKEGMLTESDVEEAEALQIELSSTTEELARKAKENGDKYDRNVRKLSEMMTTSREIFGEIVKQIKETRLDEAFIFENTLRIDETELKLKGKTVLKGGELLLVYEKEMLANAAKLESLGYYNETFDYNTIDESTRNETDNEVKALVKTKRNIEKLLDETKKVLGPIPLWSYMQETRRLIHEIKIPDLIKKAESRRANSDRLFEEINRSREPIMKNSKFHEEL